MNCIITGGTGLIGKALIKKLLRGNNNVWSIVHSAADRFENEISQIVCDFSKGGSSEIDFLDCNADAVVHLVQSNKYKEFPFKADDLFYTNVDSTFRMLEYARKNGVKTFVLASSGGIYGYGENPFIEDDGRIRQENLGFYLSTKMCAEALAENYKEYMNIVILRFFFVYGPYSKNTMLLPRLIMSVYSGNQIILQGKSGININPIYVDDAAEAIVRSLRLNESCCINIAGTEVISLRDLSEKIGLKLGKKPIFKVENCLPKHLVADTSNMEILLGKAETTLDMGLDKLIVSMEKRNYLCH